MLFQDCLQWSDKIIKWKRSRPCVSCTIISTKRAKKYAYFSKAVNFETWWIGVNSLAPIPRQTKNCRKATQSLFVCKRRELLCPKEITISLRIAVMKSCWQFLASNPFFGQDRQCCKMYIYICVCAYIYWMYIYIIAKSAHTKQGGTT